MIRRIGMLTGLGGLALLLTACGNARSSAPEESKPVAPGAFTILGYPNFGVQLRAPSNWTVRRERAPLVAVVSSGPAIIAVWSYRRSSPAPKGKAALHRAEARLISAANARDGTFKLIRASIAKIGRAPAIELDAFERIGNSDRRVRSIHVFTMDRELVLDEYAPAGMFHSVDHAVFSPVKRSLRVLRTA